MSDTETATQRCPQCRRAFHVMADEQGMHACPWCGYEPHPREVEGEGEGFIDAVLAAVVTLVASGIWGLAMTLASVE